MDKCVHHTPLVVFFLIYFQSRVLNTYILYDKKKTIWVLLAGNVETVYSLRAYVH